MATFAIESNGRLEKTAVYYNGEQLGGIREIFLNMDEDGSFDSIIQYEGVNKEIYTKDIFNDHLDNIRVVEPAFTEEEAENLLLLAIESEGDIESTQVYINDEPQEGIVNLNIHIKGTTTKGSIRNIFKTKSYIPEESEFRAEITYRNEDDSLETEEIF